MDIDEINDALVEQMSRIKGYDVTYNDGLTSDPKNLYDDGAVHISRGKYRFVFYNGQGKGQYTEKDVKRFATIVDNQIKKFNAKNKR